MLRLVVVLVLCACVSMGALRPHGTHRGRAANGATCLATANGASCPGSDARRLAVYNMRVDRALSNEAYPCHPDNGDEALFGDLHVNSYSKGLPHNDSGYVDPAAYAQLLAAIRSGSDADFEAVTMGGKMQFVNPQAGLAFDLIGMDAQQFYLPPAPAFNSAQAAGEIVEQYWQALLRDVPFDQYGTHPLSLAAAADLAKLSDFRGPTAAHLLFCGMLPGSQVGPHLSQIFYLPVQYGANVMDMKQLATQANDDFVTTWDEYLNVQRGAPIDITRTTVLGPGKRFMINGRDLSAWVHVDVLFQAYFEAFLTLMQLGAPMQSTLPYQQRPRTQDGFGTYGNMHYATLVGEVATNALHAAWFQKWFVHRRARPEVYAARVDRKLRANATGYTIHPEILNSDAITRVFAKYGSYLLPQAFPYGSPLHPSYPSGHATVAGACTTVLKAFFVDDWVIPNPVQPNADGSALLPYAGNLTVGHELNKLAENVAIGRNIAGVHWRSDAYASLRLGEAVAIAFLRDIRASLHEPFPAGWRFTSFDGQPIVIN